MGMKQPIKNAQRHYFFLNPYNDTAFCKCPKCRGKTKIRKFPLVIHIDPGQLFVLNKLSRYCTSCDLIIAKQAEIESYMAQTFEKNAPEIRGNKYLVMGTLERKDWQVVKRGELVPNETIDLMYLFKDLWRFEPVCATWHPPEKKDRQQ